jgi:hypothetical protein
MRIAVVNVMTMIMIVLKSTRSLTVSGSYHRRGIEIRKGISYESRPATSRLFQSDR